MRKFQYKNNYQAERLESHSLDMVLIKRLLGYLRPYSLFLSIALVFMMISKVIEAIVPIYIGIITQKILSNISIIESDKQFILSSIITGCLIILALLALSYILDGFNVWLKSWIGQKALTTLRLQVYSHIQKMSLSYFDRHSVGRLMTRTIHDVEQINQMFSESVVPIIGSLMLFFCIGVGIVIVDWRIAVIVGLIMPFAWWRTNVFRINQRRCYETIRAIVAAMNIFVQEHLMGTAVIRNFGLQKQEKARFEDINMDHCNAYQESIHHFSLFIAFVDFFQNTALILAFVALVAFAPIDTGFSAGTFFTFSLYAVMLFRPLGDLAERYNVLQAAMAAAERIFHVLDHPTENEGPIQGPLLDEIETIVFEEVWFAYEGENWILKGLSFSVAKGESIAIVGVTGAGKTTIMNLLMRLYEFQKGSIKINGHDIREYPVHILRRQFSVVLQDPVIFSGTIAENISLYDPNITHDKINEVVDYVNLRQLVERFPEGLDHYLSERGKSLSTGEMQLISMARAVAHAGIILILDEATANIDTGTERIIQNALTKIMHEKTALVIAHRLSTVKDASRILVMSNGVVAESGAHQELLQLKGIYEKLYRLQFLTYQ